MKALTGNFALLSVNLLVRCIQSILLGSVIERNFSPRLNFRHVRRLVIFHFGASALRRFDNDIDRVAVKCGKRVNPGPRMAVVDPLAFLAAGIPSFQTMRLPTVLAPSMFPGRARWGNLVSIISSGSVCVWARFVPCAIIATCEVLQPNPNPLSRMLHEQSAYSFFPLRTRLENARNC